MANEHNPPPSAEQKRVQVESLTRAIDRILKAWAAAIEADRSRGYPVKSPGPKVAADVVKADPRDPLHVRQMAPVTGKLSAFGDATGNQAIQASNASRWLKEARSCLILLLWSSGVTIPSEHRWTRGFYPPRMERTLFVAAEDVIDLWPKNVAVLIERIHRLANFASAEWPTTPKAGEKIGDVVVLEKGNLSETCEECKGVVGGNAADPIRRLDGKPYHQRPCYETARKRRQRTGVGVSA